MAAQKYLFVYRNSAESEARMPSPAEMQQMLAQWSAWKAQYKDEILDMGDGLKPPGKVVRAGGAITDGPFMEAKEIVGGYSIVQADSAERAAQIAKSCPVLMMPGASVEVREMAGY